MKEFKRNPGNVAFCYYRYSSDAQRDESIEQQRQAAHEYAKTHGFIIPLTVNLKIGVLQGPRQTDRAYSICFMRQSINAPAI